MKLFDGITVKKDGFIIIKLTDGLSNQPEAFGMSARQYKKLFAALINVHTGVGDSAKLGVKYLD